MIWSFGLYFKLCYSESMKYQDVLLKKNGMATISLAKALLKYSIGEKIPTVSEFSSSLQLARGTVQNAMKNLVDTEAIRVASKGHLGTYLVRKNTKMLLNFAGIHYLIGTMPLPYSKRYEGLASGLTSCLENNYDIPVNLAYMRGAANRIAMVIQDRYDFAIVSRFAAKDFIEKYPLIDIIISFGPESYTSNHALMFHDMNKKEIEDGMKVGIDSSSIDQRELVKMVCEGKKVEFVEIEYSTIIDHIIDGDIDATVMSVDEVIERKVKVNYNDIITPDMDNTEAVLIVKKENEEISALLKELIDVNAIKNIQSLVMQGKITPNY